MRFQTLPRNTSVSSKQHREVLDPKERRAEESCNEAGAASLHYTGAGDLRVRRWAAVFHPSLPPAPPRPRLVLLQAVLMHLEEMESPAQLRGERVCAQQEMDGVSHPGDSCRR